MVNFIRHILRLAFMAGAVFLFATSCASHKNCGETGAKKKYSSKRYTKALNERDSLCNLTKVQENKIAGLTKNYDEMTARYDELQRRSGTQLDKLSSDLGSNQAKLKQRE